MANCLNLFRRVFGKLPGPVQAELKHAHYWIRIRKGTFVSDEPEFARLERVLSCGDCVVDIGANVGFYTKRFAELVGPRGRVIAFEPIPETFRQLVTNMSICGFENVTFLNCAVGEAASISGMSVPMYANIQQRNFYQAHLSQDADTRVLVLSLDAMDLPAKVRLVKIDVEGFEVPVIRGMVGLIARDHPMLIVETDSAEVLRLLEPFGYVKQKFANSPNSVFHSSGNGIAY